MMACLVVGCSASAEPPAQDAHEETQSEPVQHSAPFQIGVDADLADAASEALALWRDATDGAYAPELVIGAAGRFQITLAEISVCADAADAWGCTDPNGVRVSPDVPEDQRVYVIAHEIGHTLWLHDRNDGSLMDAVRSTPDTRRAPCVSAELVSDVGMSGHGACLSDAS